MTTTLARLDGPRTTSDPARSVLPILIQVPDLASPGRRPGSPRRRRRRLRKEVRVAGLTMMSALPVGLLLLALGGAEPSERPTWVLAPRPAAEARPKAEAPQVALAEVAAPASVEFQDYLLPVDGSEEPDHAGR